MEAIPLLTLRRLPQYLEALKQFKGEGLTMVSATKIAELTGVHMTQVRRDLAYTKVVGTPKVGHNIQDLIRAIELTLNWDDLSSCFLVGAGHLGKAIMGYSGLEKRGLRILAAFDNDTELVGTVFNKIRIHPLEKLGNLISRIHVHIGIITVPASEAQGVCDVMVENGVMAIWNFSSAILNVPEDVIVENIDMSASLAVLSRRVAERRPNGNLENANSKNKK
ncbi:MAG: redox-sensing transcriptional repressor Rex [Candidatus Cloacimonadaceae bacterium]|jgi:redox-sensing transcriptional repressor|nr:redox-sensing transcriptional repressor Rex [Candidatus Cloacimonadota bacterium]MDX9949557.1 redox-sensing transcriptional repressor Rex [Candidatus Syntrophosphaera sp.]NLN85641.1 redox-sensing transcriptional repressor Rex [Candidatus Cloacimonadota bacterium]